MQSTLYQLKHAYAICILNYSGIDIKTVQELMGHADVSITQNTYTQITEQKLKIASKQIKEFIKKVD